MAKKMKPASHKQNIAAIILMARALGFEMITPKIKRRNSKVVTITPPDNPRGEDTKHSISLKKDYDGLTTHLHIPADAVTMELTEHGMFWIIGTDSFPTIKTKRYYKECINTTGDYVERITHHLTAVDYRFKHRPVSETTKVPMLMVPFRNQKGLYEFVARENGRIVERRKFFMDLPDDFELIKYINKWQSNKIAITKRRMQTGATPMRKIRKKHKVKQVRRISVENPLLVA